MNLRVVVPPSPDRPLADHASASGNLTALYATALQELGRWLTYEALRDWRYIAARWCPDSMGTPGTLVAASVPLIAIPVLPAGFELWQGTIRPSRFLPLPGVVPRRSKPTPDDSVC